MIRELRGCLPQLLPCQAPLTPETGASFPRVRQRVHRLQRREPQSFLFRAMLTVKWMNGVSWCQQQGRHAINGFNRNSNKLVYLFFVNFNDSGIAYALDNFICPGFECASLLAGFHRHNLFSAWSFGRLGCSNLFATLGGSRLLFRWRRFLGRRCRRLFRSGTSSTHCWTTVTNYTLEEGQQQQRHASICASSGIRKTCAHIRMEVHVQSKARGNKHHSKGLKGEAHQHSLLYPSSPYTLQNERVMGEQVDGK